VCVAMGGLRSPSPPISGTLVLAPGTWRHVEHASESCSLIGPPQRLLLSMVNLRAFPPALVVPLQDDVSGAQGCHAAEAPAQPITPGRVGAAGIECRRRAAVWATRMSNFSPNCSNLTLKKRTKWCCEAAHTCF
jgi:hypothetical protein